ncbi:hypothetical protein CYMTET_29002 [Cymbomonas tetramitiformis]|uniref:Uncharacterized protein n=1 Tax=Cymbomonas tetramitiformis TaxID=36881 RepID=A0AAE0FMC0_9CHLO|nr:hypothetical protein CYMTET_29002 [Cymbomonas tetramitiformis]
MSFVDESFPAGNSALGDDVSSRMGRVQWLRPEEIFPRKELKLFDGIDPSDIRQGQLGDCWLLSAFSSLAEFPLVVKSCFVTRKMNAEGYYKQAVWRFSNTGAHGYDRKTTGRSFNTNSFWKKLVTYDEKDYIMTLASHGQDEYSEGGSGPQEKTGLVGGHAYSLIAVKEVGRFRLLNVRNPWGSFEWGGDWSDGSPLWDQYPEVKEAIDPSMDFTDGDFWMDYDTALEKFSMVTVNYIKRAELEKHVSNDDDDTEESAPQPWLPPVSPIQKEVMEFLRRSPKFKQVAKHLFDEANVNGDDVVSKDELQEWTEKNWSQLTGVLGGHMSIILSPPSKETLMCIFDQSDYTGDGNLNINEYELFCATLLKEMATTAASNWKRAVQNGFQNGLRKLGDLPKVLVVPLVGIGLVLLSRR